MVVIAKKQIIATNEIVLFLKNKKGIIVNFLILAFTNHSVYKKY